MASEGIVKFETNMPETIALLYSEGKPCESEYTGAQMLYSLLDGRRMYVSLTVAEKIRAAGITPRMPFEICKRQVGKSIEWQVRTHNAAAGNTLARVPAAAPVQSDERTSQGYNGNAHRDYALNAALDSTYTALAEAPPAPPPVTKTSARLMGCLAAAIDACAEAQTYAGHRGLKILFTSEDIRCFAISAYIEQSKAVRP